MNSICAPWWENKPPGRFHLFVVMKIPITYLRPYLGSITDVVTCIEICLVAGKCNFSLQLNFRLHLMLKFISNFICRL